MIHYDRLTFVMRIITIKDKCLGSFSGNKISQYKMRFETIS